MKFAPKQYWLPFQTDTGRSTRNFLPKTKTRNWAYVRANSRIKPILLNHKYRQAPPIQNDGKVFGFLAFFFPQVKQCSERGVVSEGGA